MKNLQLLLILIIILGIHSFAHSESLGSLEKTDQLNECCKIYKKYSNEARVDLHELHKMRKLFDESNNQLGISFIDELVKRTVSDKDTIDWLYDAVYIYNNLKKCDETEINKYVLNLVDEFLFIMKSHQNALDSITLEILKENKQESLIWKYKDYDKRKNQIVKTIMKNKNILK